MNEREQTIAHLEWAMVWWRQRWLSCAKNWPRWTRTFYASLNTPLSPAIVRHSAQNDALSRVGGRAG